MKRFGWIVPTLYIIFLMLPIYWLINMSFKTNQEIFSTPWFWPENRALNPSHSRPFLPAFTAIHWISLAMIFYTFIAVINGSFYLEKSLIFSIGDRRVQAWKNFCVMPVLFFITFAGAKDKKMVWRIVKVMCLSMILVDYYVGQQVMWYRNIESRDKIHGTFAYLGPNEVAAFYNQYTIIMMSLFFYMRRGLKKFGLLILILINLYIVIFLFSRAAYIALALGMFFLFLTKKKVLLIPLLLVAMFWQVALPEKVIQRIEMTTSDYNELNKSSESRIEVWRDSLDLFSENPIFGVGSGVFNRSGFVLGDTHNIYFKILAEQGLIGIMLFLSLLLCFFTKGCQLFRDSDDPLSKGLGLGFAIAIIVLGVNNFFGDRWTYMEVGGYMWVVAALVSRLHVMELQSREPKVMIS